MRYPLLLTITCMIIWPIVGSAQTNSLFGSRGPLSQTGSSTSASVGRSGVSGGQTSGFDQGTTNGSSFGGSSMGNSSFGGSSLGGASQGSGSLFGSGGAGGGLSGGLGGQQQGFQLGGLSQTIGTGPVIGQSDNRGRQVGNRMAGQQGIMGAMQALQGLQGLQRGGGFNNNQSNQQDNERLQLRPTQRIAFDFTPATTTAAVERVSTQFAGIAERRPELADVTFATDNDGNVILRGNVASKEAAQLAAALVRLEPGVRGVVNELDVAGGTTP
ncbi:MAG: BON domain-containing protein [Planctomycetaceae bacterium]